MTEVLICTPRSLPRGKWIESAERAVTVNPANHPRMGRLMRAMPEIIEFCINNGNVHRAHGRSDA